MTSALFRSSKRFLLASAAFLAFSAPARPQPPAGEMLHPADVPALFTRLSPGHPRLLFTTKDQERIQALCARDPFLRGIIMRLRDHAEEKLDEPCAEYKLIGPRLLEQSRKALSTILTSAMAYRLTGDSRFALRAKREMLAVAAFPDWHPPHFLDVAEMTAGVAIGYDWLYSSLTPSERQIVRQAIVHKGLEPAKKIYPDHEWAVVSHNWNQVCNAGMTLGALAIAEDEPALAREILSDAVASIPKSMASYAPDGLWAEGPGYWEYGTSYNALFISALKSAFGVDGGFPKMPGFAKTGFFRIQTIGPGSLDFNYADVSTPHADETPVLFWLAQTFDQPAFAAAQRTLLAPYLTPAKPPSDDRLFAMNIAWYPEAAASATSAGLPLDSLFRGDMDLVTFRSAWADQNALFVGFKGGRNAANHAHLDIGSFVLDANGERWAINLGSDDYDLPGYFDTSRGDASPRWQIYRIGTRSQNTLLIGGRNQPVDATARVIAFHSSGSEARAVLDMTPAYRGFVSKALRGIALLDRSRVLIQDELSGLAAGADVRWGMITMAGVDLHGNKAVLSQHGATLDAEILEPAGAQFELISTKPDDPSQNPNTGSTMLAARIPPRDQVSSLRIAILLTPQGAKSLGPPSLANLGSW